MTCLCTLVCLVDTHLHLQLPLPLCSLYACYRISVSTHGFLSLHLCCACCNHSLDARYSSSAALTVPWQQMGDWQLHCATTHHIRSAAEFQAYHQSVFEGLASDFASLIATSRLLGEHIGALSSPLRSSKASASFTSGLVSHHHGVEVQLKQCSSVLQAFDRRRQWADTAALVACVTLGKKVADHAIAFVVRHLELQRVVAGSTLSAHATEWKGAVAASPSTLPKGRGAAAGGRGRLSDGPAGLEIIEEKAAEEFEGEEEEGDGLSMPSSFADDLEMGHGKAQGSGGSRKWQAGRSRKSNTASGGKRTFRQRKTGRRAR